MVVLILRKAKEGIKGKVTRWLSEVGPGIYLGRLPARVREKLWLRVVDEMGEEAGAVLVWSDQTEQGYSVRSAGSPAYGFRDFEGLWLAERRKSA